MDIFKRIKQKLPSISSLKIHTKIAFLIILIQTPFVGILFASGFQPWVKFQMIYLTAAMVITILIAPHISKILILRRRFHYTDSLNQRQRAAITKFDLIGLYKVSQLHANDANLRPYLERLTILGLAINCFDSLIPERSLIGAIPLAISIYICFQILLIILATNRKKAARRRN